MGSASWWILITMQTDHDIRSMRAQVRAWRDAGHRIALVPTMGNLHAGHLALVTRAHEVADRVVASVFVNPLQFGPTEDFDAYPRTLEADAVKLAEAGVDALFAPDVHTMYPHGQEGMTRVEVPGLSGLLCGATRPGHFAGVATVVNKLFNQVQPDTAVFGEKDWQQLLVIRRMVRDLDMPVEIIGVPTRREPDGLAMSSRNGYLSADERRQAVQLYTLLKQLAQRLQAGERDHALLEAEGSAALQAAGFRPDYLSIRRAEDLEVPGSGDKALIILAAAYLGRARLIDNVQVSL